MSQDSPAARSGKDQELAQTRLRLGVTLAATSVLLLAAVMEHVEWIVPGISAIYMLVSLLWYRFVTRYPGHYPLRRIIPMASDLGLTAISAHMLDPVDWFFYPIGLWIVAANGARFGLRYLMIAISFAIAAFGGVVAFDDYWWMNIDVIMGLAIGLVVLPSIYFALVRRLHALNSRLEQELARAAHAASHDGLTGLNNLLHFRQQLEREVDRAVPSRSGLSVLFVDLDGFKGVNDALGHAAGDRVLAQTARCIESAVRETDVVARLGGDEFGVLLPGVVRQDAIDLVCERILSRVEGIHREQAGCPPVTASIGVSILHEDAQSADQLLGQADRAMYEAKRAGRNAARLHAI